MTAAPSQLAAHPAPFTSRQLGPADLAELVASFSEVTQRLEETHDQLRAEVARLKAELGEANAALERSRRLAALGEMAAGISHEVRNPLGSIRLYARLLDQDLATLPEPRKLVGKIAAAATTLDAIVGDVLTFAREFKMKPAPCDARELLEHAREACSHDGVQGFGQARIVIDCPRDIQFHADAPRVQQALINIVRNALEAVHDAIAAGSSKAAHEVRLTATTREVVGPSGRTEPMVVLAVRDTGKGVTPDIIDRMFNPFFTTRHTGTGLGLAIVHRIADAHAGRVTVAPNAADGDPRGTTVELLLPLHPPASPPAPAGQSTEPEHHQPMKRPEIIVRSGTPARTE